MGACFYFPDFQYPQEFGLVPSQASLFVCKVLSTFTKVFFFLSMCGLFCLFFVRFVLVAALARSRMNRSLPVQRTIRHITQGRHGQEKKNPGKRITFQGQGIL